MDTISGNGTHLEGGNGRSLPGYDKDLDAQIIRRVLEGFDQRDRAVSNAVKEFLAFHQNALECEENREILKRIESPETLDAVVQYHRATIALLAARSRHKSAQRRFEITSSNLRLKIREFEVADDDWELRIHKLDLVKSDGTEREIAFQKIFEFVKSMVEGTAEIPLQSIREGHLPDSVNHSLSVTNDNMGLFFVDLATFLLDPKVEGQKIFLSISEDSGIAKEVAFDPNAPPVSRFWAALTLKYVHKDS